MPEMQKILKLELSSEEKRVFKECEVESVWYRCVPFSVGLIAATNIAVKKGYIANHSKFGLLFKYFGCCVSGYIIGKISYMSACQQKFLALPNSRLADSIRMRKSGSQMFTDRGEVQDTVQDTPMSDSGLRSYEFRSSMDLDTNSRLAPKGLDDSKRPSIDNVPRIRREENPMDTSMTYDELQRRNREGQRKSYQQVLSPEMQKPRPPPSRKPTFFADHQKEKNKYGDDLESES